MANDIDKTSSHYKGEFGSIYEVNQKFPSGGVEGDYVAIDGWAHYWNADRGSWCVNAERDSYWDELMTNIIEKFKLFRGATYMGVASLDTVPAKAIGVKMYYFATVPGTYTNFGDIAVLQGISVLYSEDGKSWSSTLLLEVTQEAGESSLKVVSQKLLKKTQNLINNELEKKANSADVEQSFSEQTAKNTAQDAEIAKKANAADVTSKFNEEAARVDAELDKKANSADVDSKFSEESARVDTELAKKANAADVAKVNAEQDKEIGKKANQQDVERSLNILKKEIGDRTIVEGNVNNNPDEEDLTSKMGSNNREVLSLRDREYNPLEFSGKGYKILRKNLQEVTCAITKIQVTKAPTTDGYVSIIINGVETHVDLVASTDNTDALVAKKIADKLSETMDEYVTSIDGALVTCTRRFGGDVTSSSFSGVNTKAEASVSESSKTEFRNLITPVMVNQPNTIYEIRYDFDLDGETIEMKEGCTLKFEGGCLKNGKINGNSTKIIAKRESVFVNTTISGTWKNAESYPEWFGAKSDGVSDDRDAINNAVKVSEKVFFDGSKIYALLAYKDDIIADKRSGIIVKDNTTLEGNQCTLKVINYNNLGYNAICCYNVNNVSINNFNIFGDRTKETESSKNENGYGIGVHGSSNITVSNCYTCNCMGDGIYIGSKNNYTGDEFNSKHIVVQNCKSENNYRNALSLICCDDVRFYNSEFIDEGYYVTIDLEPNHNYESIKNVVFDSCIITNESQTPSFMLDDTVDLSIVEVKIKNCTITGLVRILQKNGNSKFDLSYSNITDGSIRIDGIGIVNVNNVHLAKRKVDYGISFDKYHTKGLERESYCNFNNIVIDCSNTQGTGNTLALGFISGTAESPNIYKKIHFNNIEIINDNADKPIRLYNYAELDESVSFKNVTINGIYKDNTIGNPMNLKSLDLTINDTITSDIYERIGFYKGYIFNETNSRNIKLEPGWVSDGYHYIRNVSESNKYIKITSSFDNLFVNGFPSSSNELVLNPTKLIRIYVDNSTSFCNIELPIEVRGDINYNGLYVGQMWFDTVKKTLFIWDGAKWSDVFGDFFLNKKKGTTEDRPELSSSNEGFTFYDATLKKMILWNGTDWVNLDGTELT